MTRLLVTGAGGLIGGAVVRAAAAAVFEGTGAGVGVEVIAVGRRRPDALPDGVTFLSADLSDAAQAAAAVRQARPDRLIHAAWHTRHPSYWHDMDNLDWVVSAAAMARALAEGGGRRFVQVGSCAEYDWTAPDRRTDGPATRYGKAKLAAFRAVEAAAQDRFAATEARVFWVYGPGENPARFIPLTCLAHLRGDVPALGSGRQERDLVYVDDAAAALLALTRDDAPAGVVDLGTGRGTPLATAAAIIAGLAGHADSGLGRRPDRTDDPLRLIADPAPLAAAGWAPRVSLEDGLRRTFEAWRATDT